VEWSSPQRFETAAEAALAVIKKCPSGTDATRFVALRDADLAYDRY
jgi:hypothetical protein